MSSHESKIIASGCTPYMKGIFFSFSLSFSLKHLKKKQSTIFRSLWLKLRNKHQSGLDFFFAYSCKADNY